MDEGYLSAQSQWQGRFWLPGQEDADQRGILTYVPDEGVRLALIGGFDDAEWLPGSRPGTRVLSERTRNWRVIHGTVGSANVTLLDCVVQRSTSYLTGASVSRGGTSVVQQEIRAERLLPAFCWMMKASGSFRVSGSNWENLTEWHYVPDIRTRSKSPRIRRNAGDGELRSSQSTPLRGCRGMLVELARSYRLPSHDLRRVACRRRPWVSRTSRCVQRNREQPKSGRKAAQGFQDLLTLEMDSSSAILRLTLIPTEELFESREQERVRKSGSMPGTSSSVTLMRLV